MTLATKTLRAIIPLLFVACFNTSVSAEEIAIKENQPGRHVVVQGDTLWGIAGKFLKNPWQWPKVWNMNKADIKNPHRIYPGDVVMLDTSGASPRFKLLHETVVLQPTAIEEPLEKVAIKTIQPSAITPFLTHPMLVSAEELKNSPRIIGGQDSRVVLSKGERVYVSGLNSEKNFWNVFRPGGNLVDPDTGENLASEAIYLGDVRITKFGQPASGQIVNMREEIWAKDRLTTATEGISVNFIPHAPEKVIGGRIIKIYGGVGESGPKSVVVLNRGQRDGLEDGHVLVVMRRGGVIVDPELPKPVSDSKPREIVVVTKADGSKEVNFKRPAKSKNNGLKSNEVQLPDERIGLMMVFRTYEKVSYALIMNSDGAVYELDSFTTP